MVFRVHTSKRYIHGSETKELYEAPSTMVFEVKQEGVICASGESERQDYDYEIW